MNMIKLVRKWFDSNVRVRVRVCVCVFVKGGTWFQFNCVAVYDGEHSRTSSDL